jgi:Berberine and berberine like
LFQAHPVSMVYAGPIFWDHKHARALMQRYRDFLPSAPEELGSFLGLKTVLSTDPFPREHWGKRACVLISCYNGPAELGEKAMASILKDLPPPMFNWMDVMPFPSLQGMFDPFLPKGLQWYWKGDYVKTLSDEAIDVHIAQTSNMPSELSLMHLYPIDGAVHRVGEDETAWRARDATWSMVIVGIDPEPQNARALQRWGKAYWEAVHPFNSGGGYVNFMMDDEGEARIKATYGDNFERLVALKQKFDPANLFRVNQNIRPSA